MLLRTLFTTNDRLSTQIFEVRIIFIGSESIVVLSFRYSSIQGLSGMSPLLSSVDNLICLTEGDGSSRFLCQPIYFKFSHIYICPIPHSLLKCNVDRGLPWWSSS